MGSVRTLAVYRLVFERRVESAIDRALQYGVVIVSDSTERPSQRPADRPVHQSSRGTAATFQTERNLENSKRKTAVAAEEGNCNTFVPLSLNDEVDSSPSMSVNKYGKVMSFK